MTSGPDTGGTEEHHSVLTALVLDHVIGEGEDHLVPEEDVRTIEEVCGQVLGQRAEIGCETTPQDLLTAVVKEPRLSHLQGRSQSHLRDQRKRAEWIDAHSVPPDELDDPDPGGSK